MEKFQEILLEVWREACRDIEIGMSCSAISSILSLHMPLSQVLIREFDHTKSNLETIALGLNQSKSIPKQAITFFNGNQWNSLIEYFKKNRILHKNDTLQTKELATRITESSPDQDTLIGILKNKNDLSGLLILKSAANTVFAKKHVEMMEILLEPFSIALRNNFKIRQINTLREAAEADNKSLLERLSRTSIADTVVGVETGLRQVMERVALAAPSDVPVIILGETGTGKELISREIHRLSGRSEGPFIRVNCGSIPAELIDSQLFGHEKGAFTGALSTHYGWFERAHSGTLFLDEIGELPLAGQVRLLRIIQDGWMERVGGKHPIHVDVRIVIATHRDLAEMIRQGKFREDLWYRLSVFPILLPALKDRREDISELANHFAKRAAIRFHLPLQLPSKMDVELLSKYHWPGNIRELGSVIDRAAILGNGNGLKIDISLGWTGKSNAQRNPIETEEEFESDNTLLSLDEMNKRYIEKALQWTQGRVEGPLGAANVLKLNPNTLRAKMRKLNVDWKQFRILTTKNRPD